VSDDDKEHADHVLEECAKKVCKDMTSDENLNYKYISEGSEGTGQHF
jgi:hypothetical protein